MKLENLERKVFLQTPSRLLQYIQTKLWKRYVAKTYIRYTLNLYNNPTLTNEFQTLTSRIDQTLKEHNINGVFLVFPQIDLLNKENYDFKPIHKKLHAIFNNNKIPFIDFTQIFKMHDPQTLTVHPVDSHPNEKAHRLIAQSVEEYLLNNVLAQ